MNPADILTEDQARVMVHLRERGPQTTDEIGATIGWRPTVLCMWFLYRKGLAEFATVPGGALWWVR